jgi:hypothetical protein
MRLDRALVGALGSVSLVLGLGGGCVYRSDAGSSQDSDARIAFDKSADALDEVERYCLKSAQLFCAGLEPCCASINYSFERDICILVRAEHCIAPRGADATFLPEGAQACLDRLEHEQFQDCLQPLGEAKMPIALHRQPACDAAWARTGPQRYAPGDACNQGLKLCPEGYFCDTSVEGAARTCIERLPEASDCEYDSDCKPGLYCGPAGTCTGMLELGRDCEYRNECASDLCCGRQCVRAPAVDAHLCWIFNYPGGDYPRELGDTENACVSIAYNTTAQQQ